MITINLCLFPSLWLEYEITCGDFDLVFGLLRARALFRVRMFLILSLNYDRCSFPDTEIWKFINCAAFFFFVLRCVSSQLTHSKGRRWGQKFGRNFSFCTLLATKTRRLLIAIKSTAAARVFSSLILCCSSTSHYASTHEILRLWKMRVFKTTATPPPSTPRPLTQAHFIIIGRVRSVLYGSCENSCAHIKHIVSIRTLFHHPMHSLWVLEFN